MTLRLIQYQDERRRRKVGVVRDAETIAELNQPTSVLALALAAADGNTSLAEMVADRVGGQTRSYQTLVDERRLLTPIDHPDSRRCILSGTGLNHTGSAMARDAMHREDGTPAADATDSMRMFQIGVEGGKPAPGQVGAAPEWFYKGDGSGLVAPEHPLPLPGFSGDGGEEAEVVAIYVVDNERRPRRVGFALGNEFADHVVERENYLYLAASKLRGCSFGPELRVGELPADVSVQVRVIRAGEEIWSDVFKTGEANMTHSLANMEHHHFKYPGFRRAGDLHCHFLGTATLSYAAGVAAVAGDRFEIESVTFGRPLRNELGPRGQDHLIQVQPL